VLRLGGWDVFFGVGVVGMRFLWVVFLLLRLPFAVLLSLFLRVRPRSVCQMDDVDDVVALLALLQATVGFLVSLFFQEPSETSLPPRASRLFSLNHLIISGISLSLLLNQARF
jgi:hypothetical protein